MDGIHRQLECLNNISTSLDNLSGRDLSKLNICLLDNLRLVLLLIVLVLGSNNCLIRGGEYLIPYLNLLTADGRGRNENRLLSIDADCLQLLRLDDAVLDVTGAGDVTI